MFFLAQETARTLAALTVVLFSFVLFYAAWALPKHSNKPSNTDSNRRIFRRSAFWAFIFAFVVVSWGIAALL